MLERFVAGVQRVAARVVAWQINRHHEQWATRLLDQVHLGASLDWVSELVEIRGRHALRVAHH